MTRHYAKEFFNWPDYGGCPVCGLEYVKGSPEDEREHRSRHREVLAVFEPSPNAALKRENGKHGRFVPVTAASPRWLHRRLYNIARMLNRENGYDFVMWDEGGDDGDGFIITSPDGCALGGCAMCWRDDWKDAPSIWGLQWIWIAPPYRRQGLMRGTWAMLTSKYDAVYPEHPYSAGMARFLRDAEHLDELPAPFGDYVRAAVRVGLRDDADPVARKPAERSSAAR